MRAGERDSASDEVFAGVLSGVIGRQAGVLIIGALTLRAETSPLAIQPARDAVQYLDLDSQKSVR